MATENENLFLDLSGQSGDDNQNNDNNQKTAEELAAEQALLDAEQAVDNANQENNQKTAEELAAEQAAADAANQNNNDDIVIEDSKLLKVLSEKLGREIQSLDELTKREETQLNPQIKAIADWADKTGRPIEDWVKFNKDYSTMSDVDKAREILSLKYPSFTEKEIELELSQFVESEDDLQEDIDVKTKELKKLISNDGKLLEDVKLELGKPIEGYNVIPEEIKAEVDFAKAARESYDRAMKSQEVYDTGIKTAVDTMTGLEIDLDEGLKIDYNMSPEDKKDLPSFLSEMPHWKNTDGSMNHNAVVADALKIRNFDKIMKMVYQQGVAKGNEQLLKDANNITLGQRQTLDSDQPDGGNKGIVIEGLEKLTGMGTRVKYGRSKTSN